MPCLDGLRFVAIGMVLFEHFGGYPVKYLSTGYYGVDLFLVISGFLITTILLKDKQERFWDSYRIFMGRRFLRIFPLYYAVIAFILIVNITGARDLSIWLLTYTFNYGAVIYNETHENNPIFYLWSLSLEEQFYLFWPLIAICLKKKPRILFGVTFGIVCIGFLQSTHSIFPGLAKFNYTGLVSRMGSLGLGALAATYLRIGTLPTAFFRNRLVELLAFGLLAFSLLASYPYPYRPVFLGLVSLYLVIKATQFEFRLPGVQRALTHRAVVYIGSISYGIYLMHMPFGALMTEYVFDPLWNKIPFASAGPLAVIQYHSWLLKLPLYSGVSILMAALSFRYFEQPILKLKDKWFRYPAKNR
ncbi:acyltransferase family protein [Cerasicoccus arenae]|nr:acyltransferase [Cerasicoccus arenae]